MNLESFFSVYGSLGAIKDVTERVKMTLRSCGRFRFTMMQT